MPETHMQETGMQETHMPETHMQETGMQEIPHAGKPATFINIPKHDHPICISPIQCLTLMHLATR